MKLIGVYVVEVLKHYWILLTGVVFSAIGIFGIFYLKPIPFQYWYFIWTAILLTAQFFVFKDVVEKVATIERERNDVARERDELRRRLEPALALRYASEPVHQIETAWTSRIILSERSRHPLGTKQTRKLRVSNDSGEMVGNVVVKVTSIEPYPKDVQKLPWVLQPTDFNLPGQDSRLLDFVVYLWEQENSAGTLTIVGDKSSLKIEPGEHTVTLAATCSKGTPATLKLRVTTKGKTLEIAEVDAAT